MTINKYLKTLCLKSSDVNAFLRRLIDHCAAPVGVFSMDHTLLLGPDTQGSHEVAINLDGQQIGYIKGENVSDVSMIQEALTVLLEKEASGKEMGKEVLQLYREINLIYDFSEQLASTIDPPGISRIALDQAKKLIVCDAGRVILFEEGTKAIKLLAQFGQTSRDEHIIAFQQEIIDRFLAEAKTDIIADTKVDYRTKDIPTSVTSLLYAPLRIGERVIGMIVLGTTAAHTYKANDLKILNTLALQAASAIESSLLYEKNIQEIQSREAALKRVHDATKKFVPHDFIKLLGRESIEEIVLGDQVQRDVTVMFLDIRDYTSFSESMTPDENFKFLNRYIGRLEPVITGNRGMIMSFLGDGIMALFLHDTDDALQAGIDIHHTVARYNRERAKKNRRPLRLGIGMHHGPLIMGILGNDQRQEANLVSDTVNTASRMEGLTKYYGASIIASESVFTNMKKTPGFGYRSLGKVQVKGKRKALEIFDVFESDPQPLFFKKQETRRGFQQGLLHYHQRSFDQATAAFAKVLSINPEDRAAQLYLNNAIQYLTSGVGTDWEGVEIMEIK
jgi:class 3 adenylate cyclase